jgi:transcriptional regulator GlxA family with amidase domain
LGFFDNTYAYVSRDIRMTLANALLTSGRYRTVEEVAVASGYANATSFRICYKKWHGDYPQLVKSKSKAIHA